MSFHHPLCRIPPIQPRAAEIDTEKGPMPPERALAYDQGALLLHGPAATRPDHCFTLQELANYSKTASRLLLLLQPWPWARIHPLEWQSPQQLTFAIGGLPRHACRGTKVNPLIYDLIQLHERLEQLETLTLLKGPPSALSFRRC